MIAVEEPFSIYLEGCPVPIIGAMDLIEEDSSGTIIINDFKTAGRAYSNDEVDRNFQLTPLSDCRQAEWIFRPGDPAQVRLSYQDQNAQIRTLLHHPN